MPEPAIEIEGLTKDYKVGFWRPRPYRALDHLTLAVEPGELFGFLGPNGAGKSTTLKLLMQLVYPTSGRAAILGQPIGDRSVKRRIGFLPENPYFYDYLTAEELLHYFARLFGIKNAAARVAAVLDEVGIGAERRMRLRAFSKGMIQRVGIAQAVLNEPEVLFFDEPMSGLDPIGRHEVRQLLLRLRNRGCTVFFSSHILSDAESLCTRVGIVAQGRLVASGRVSELVAFERRGWELMVEGIDAITLQAVAMQTAGATELAPGRFSLSLPAEQRPEPLLARLVANGGRVLSLTPVHATLEEYFVAAVSSAAPRDDQLTTSGPRAVDDEGQIASKRRRA